MSKRRQSPQRKQSVKLSTSPQAGTASNLATPGPEPAPSTDGPETPANSLSISKPKYNPEHPAAHLREHRFKPGESGNPSGRPKGIFGVTALKRLLRAGKNSETKLIALIDAQIDKAIRKHDTRAAEFLRDSIDGRPAASDGDSANNGQVTIVWNGPPPAWVPRVDDRPERQNTENGADSEHGSTVLDKKD
jgi:hypothetical protein